MPPQPLSLGDFFCPYVIVAVVCAILGHSVASQKEAGAHGLLYGLLFGPLGLLAACFIDEREECKHCGTRLKHGCPVCPGCNKEVEWPLGVDLTREQRIHQLNLRKPGGM